MKAEKSLKQARANTSNNYGISRTDDFNGRKTTRTVNFVNDDDSRTYNFNGVNSFVVGIDKSLQGLSGIAELANKSVNELFDAIKSTKTNNWLKLHGYHTRRKPSRKFLRNNKIDSGGE